MGDVQLSEDFSAGGVYVLTPKSLIPQQITHLRVGAKLAPGGADLAPPRLGCGTFRHRCGAFRRTFGALRKCGGVLRRCRGMLRNRRGVLRRPWDVLRRSCGAVRRPRDALRSSRRAVRAGGRPRRNALGVVRRGRPGNDPPIFTPSRGDVRPATNGLELGPASGEPLRGIPSIVRNCEQA